MGWATDATGLMALKIWILGPSSLTSPSVRMQGDGRGWGPGGLLGLRLRHRMATSRLHGRTVGVKVHGVTTST